MSSPVSLLRRRKPQRQALRRSSRRLPDRAAARSAARRGSGTRPISFCSATPAFGPQTRTTAIAAGGRPEDSAKIVGRSLSRLSANRLVIRGSASCYACCAARAKLPNLALPRIGNVVRSGASHRPARPDRNHDHHARRTVKTGSRTKRAPISSSTSTIRSIGGPGDRRRWRRPNRATSRSCSRSAMRLATGAT